MKPDCIISLGYNCAVSEVVSQIKCFQGCSPFDWCFVEPKSVNKVLSSLYTFEPEEILNLYEIKNEAIPFFKIKSPHYKPDDRGKMERRISRFLTTLKSNKSILFVYAFPYRREILQFSSFLDDLVKMSKILQLFRAKDTFRIAVLHPEECLAKKILENHNIDEISLPYVPEEKYWIFPLLQALKENYEIETVNKGSWSYEIK